MKLMRRFLKGLLIAGILLGAWCGQAAGKVEQGEVLVQVAGDAVTAADLEQAVKSSPFATQFNTLDENEQAALRGDLLKRLVAFRLLRMEAHARGLDESAAYRKEEQEYRIARLYRYYTDRLRRQLTLPPETQERLTQEYQGQADALAAARANERVQQYRKLKLLTVRMLRDRLQVVFHEDRIRAGITPDTLLMEGDGVQIRYGDLLEAGQLEEMPTREWLEERLYQRAELLLFARAAEQEGVDIEAAMAAFRQERLPALLIEQLEGQWAGDEQILRQYYDDHPELSYLSERWHVGQLVLSSYAQAAAMRKRILAGESLFVLAGRYSIDPWGRAHNGDMGWLKEGQGNPAIEGQLKRMADGKVSGIIRSARGYHLVTVLERRPAFRRSFASVKDRVRQALVQERLAAYLQELQQKYPVKWKVLATSDEATSGS
jgi:peptidyl-prolyl cis-trans isomerase C